jgi:hypothetical protein
MAFNRPSKANMIRLLGILTLFVLGVVLVAAVVAGAGLILRWFDRHR